MHIPGSGANKVCKWISTKTSGLKLYLLSNGKSNFSNEKKATFQTKRKQLFKRKESNLSNEKKATCQTKKQPALAGWIFVTPDEVGGRKSPHFPTPLGVELIINLDRFLNLHN